MPYNTNPTFLERHLSAGEMEIHQVHTIHPSFFGLLAKKTKIPLTRSECPTVAKNWFFKVLMLLFKLG